MLMNTEHWPLIVAWILMISFVHCKPRIVSISDQRQSCESFVYCQGPLLDIVQRARLFPDSKTFVDMSQTNSPEETFANFNDLMDTTENHPTKEQLVEFINRNFLQNSDELDYWSPEDYTQNPRILSQIKDKELKKFTGDLINIWPSLGRKVSEKVFKNPEKYSLIPVPNGFIIPGGRFKELYYWDSYWIIEGLLISDMDKTAKGMIENLLFMVEKYGFIPNGGRIYYLNRSQPPLLTLMANIYLEKTKDLAFIHKNIALLDKELTYWIEKKTIDINFNGNLYRMAHYQSESNTPRPESYIEDINTCSYFDTIKSQEHCYQGLKSGAESGWDFSSRWFFDHEGGIRTNLTHIDAQRVVPVDLNAFLCVSFAILSSFYMQLGDAESAQKWAALFEQWLNSIQEVLYNEEDGIWYDFDLTLSRPRKIFYPSNFAPLWAGTYNPIFKKEYGRRAATYFNRMEIAQFKGGIPTSLDGNNEQWDMPNAWPPLQEIVILGLWNTGEKQARKIAKYSAERWLEANLRGFNEQNAMFEKYDSTRVGQYGGGGEYEVQKGFGWTNGVALKLIEKFYTFKNKLEKTNLP
ncbi:hypothetical protein ABEB36_009776 [Hypothenemus hampei]|uniref:Trehalase n=1 Tax=Hypothenemus hampei TaxID=57062 RepID=A0ABD1EHE9_HYPHA